jgi:hypothetical protein
MMNIRLLRCFTVLALAPVLYGAPAALASEAAAIPAIAAEKPATVAPTPHIALLLPIRSKIFARHARALREGFMAAAKSQSQPLLPVREYPVSEAVDETLKNYRSAIAAGAKVVVVPVPTLALNIPDQTGRVPGNLYMLSLQVEGEARQAAQLAYRDNRRRAQIIVSGTPVQRRTQAAFSAEFSRLGGTVLAEAIPPDPSRLKSAARNDADRVFLALDHEDARIVRAYLGTMPAYATSSVNAGDRGALAAFDLANITFVDMPWLLEPDHPAVMNYPRPEPGSADIERLYALGIDAWRIAQLLLAGARELKLDGVTGELKLGPEGIIERTLRAGRYVDGRTRLTEPTTREPSR